MGWIIFIIIIVVLIIKVSGGGKKRIRCDICGEWGMMPKDEYKKMEKEYKAGLIIMRCGKCIRLGRK